MKKIIKTTIIILITTLLIFNIPLYSRASTLDQVISDGDSFLNVPASGSGGVPNTINETELQRISNMVSNVLLSIAIAVTLISAVVMAINFTIQSIEDKAKIKESMVPWIIGIFISFGAYTIWQVTMNLFLDIT